MSAALGQASHRTREERGRGGGGDYPSGRIFSERNEDYLGCKTRGQNIARRGLTEQFIVHNSVQGGRATFALLTGPFKGTVFGS